MARPRPDALAIDSHASKDIDRTLLLPAPAARWALFLDLDGTLADIEQHPDDVRVPASLVDTLRGLTALLDGALAVVSGRRIVEIDRILAPLSLPAAGLHGLERRDARGALRRTAVDAAAVAAARERLTAFAAGRAGLLVEDKGDSLALHYRGAPAEVEACRALATALAASSPAFALLEGKMVFELKPAVAGKDRAVREFLGEAPFAGRTPVFAGDDVTDEDGFRVVLEHRGVALKVGPGVTLAPHRLDDADALRAWLDALLRHWREAPA